MKIFIQDANLQRIIVVINLCSFLMYSLTNPILFSNKWRIKATFTLESLVGCLSHIDPKWATFTLLELLYAVLIIRMQFEFFVCNLNFSYAIWIIDTFGDHLLRCMNYVEVTGHGRPGRPKKRLRNGVDPRNMETSRLMLKYLYIIWIVGTLFEVFVHYLIHCDSTWMKCANLL